MPRKDTHPLGPNVLAEDVASYGGGGSYNRSWRTCITYGGKNTFTKAICPNMIEVHQRGRNGRFRVIYGLSVKENLTYAQAAHKFGECVFHLETLKDNLGNEGP